MAGEGYPQMKKPMVQVPLAGLLQELQTVEKSVKALEEGQDAIGRAISHIGGAIRMLGERTTALEQAVMQLQVVVKGMLEQRPEQGKAEELPEAAAEEPEAEPAIVQGDLYEPKSGPGTEEYALE